MKRINNKCERVRKKVNEEERRSKKEKEWVSKIKIEMGEKLSEDEIISNVEK